VRTLYLIKHGAPQIRTDVCAHEWSLSEHGRAQARALAQRLATRELAAVVTSEEPKAVETGRVIAEALDVRLRRGLGLHEQLRYTQPWYASRTHFDRSLLEFFARPSERVLGEETADEAHMRFTNALRAALEITSGNVALVAHGTVISLLVARANGLEAARLWQQLGFCEFHTLSYPGLQLVRDGSRPPPLSCMTDTRSI
jgi:broad specificity phosphatase PhoE